MRIRRPLVVTLMPLLAACERTLQPESNAVRVQIGIVWRSNDTITVGDSVRFSIGAVDARDRLISAPASWTSSQPTVATVDSAGIARALAPGLTTITGAVRGASDSLPLRVAELASRIVLTPNDLALVPGEYLHLAVQGLDHTGAPAVLRNVHWASSDSSVVVPDYYWVTGVGEGTATIAATAGAATGSAQVVVRSVTLGRPAAGGFHTCALSGDSTAYCWGYWTGSHGSGPSSVPGGQRYSLLAAGLWHTCGLRSDGVVICWGDDFFGAAGGGSAAAGGVGDGLAFVELSAGAWHTCGIGRDGTTYCWGLNDHGELGAPTTQGCPIQYTFGKHCSSRPVAVLGGLQLRSISAGGDHTCGLTAEGDAYCWGANTRGQLGDSTNSDRPAPVRVAGELRFRSIFAGAEFTCGLTAAGAAWCWGLNSYGQLGTGTTTNSSVPRPVAGALSFQSLTVATVPSYSDGAHACGVALTGRAYCWGVNYEPALGVPPGATRLIPTEVTGGLSFRSVSAGWAHTCGLGTDGIVYCWGNNFDGQLGVPGGGTWVPQRVSGQRNP